MSSSTPETKHVLAISVTLSADALTAELSDGRTISVPLSWYPRLLHANSNEREEWRLIGNGRGIHWPALDEDISVENLLFGQPSREGQASLQRWLDARRNSVEYD